MKQTTLNIQKEEEQQQQQEARQRRELPKGSDGTHAVTKKTEVVDKEWRSCYNSSHVYMGINCHGNATEITSQNSL